MRIVFMGTPEFAVASLDAIAAAEGHELVAVVTQPGRPKGRGRRPTPSPVRVRADELDRPVLEPERLKGPFVEQLRQLAPDLLAVVAYGKILPPEVLAVPRLGAVNVHPSLLPRHRGASPIQHAVLGGDLETGVTTMLLNEEIDSGAMLLQERVPIGADEDAVELADRLCSLGARMLVETIERVEGGAIESVEQDAAAASYAPKLKAEDAWIDWELDAGAIARRVRGLVPWPVAQTCLPDGKRLKILAATALDVESTAGAAPGTIVEVSKRRIAISCGRGLLIIRTAQLEGKKPATAADLVNGRKLVEGVRLGGS